MRASRLANFSVHIIFNSYCVAYFILKQRKFWIYFKYFFLNQQRVLSISNIILIIIHHCKASIKVERFHNTPLFIYISYLISYWIFKSSPCRSFLILQMRSSNMSKEIEKSEILCLATSIRQNSRLKRYIYVAASFFYRQLVYCR